MLKVKIFHKIENFKCCSPNKMKKEKILQPIWESFLKTIFYS